MAKANLGPLGWSYIGMTLGWTAIVVATMAFLWHHRRLPHLQMRRLPLVFTALTMLHLYGAVCFIGYVILPIAPCATEYWIMSILVPFGVAIFQVANTQFLHIASQQRKFTSVRSLDELVRSNHKVSALDGVSGNLWQRTVARLKAMDRITRMVLFIGSAMALQATLTIIIFLLSRKFHPEFGVIPANLLGSPMEVRMNCSRGWEWLLSIVWQFFWSWIYAPYLLWKTRHVQDTHGWRIQTILCCIAGLPASPLWLCGLYVPQFGPVDLVFIPPAWFSVSIMFIEAFALGIPCWQVYKHHSLQTETLAAIADWESKNKSFGSLDSDSTKVQSPTSSSFKLSEKGSTRPKSWKSAGDNSVSSRKSHMFTMVALEHALKWNAMPLQKFAALKDFSGENISFLTHLASWKRSWAQPDRSKHRFTLPSERESGEQSLRNHFNSAIRLYAAFVSPEHAEFPINVSSKTLRILDDMFGTPAELLFGDTRSESSFNSATPFNDFEKKQANVRIDVDLEALPRLSDDTYRPDDVWYWGDIPEAFTAAIFDESEGEIKYLVLTNTWPKFVNAGYAEQIAENEEKSLSKRLSHFFYRGQKKDML